MIVCIVTDKKKTTKNFKLMLPLLLNRDLNNFGTPCIYIVYIKVDLAENLHLRLLYFSCWIFSFVKLRENTYVITSSKVFEYAQYIIAIVMLLNCKNPELENIFPVFRKKY